MADQVRGIPSHSEFIQSVKDATHRQRSKTLSFSVDDPSAFEEMRAYILDKSENVEVQHSFINDHGQIFDCVPIEQQASARATKGEIATPVDLKINQSSAAPAGSTVAAPLLAGGNDRFGNAMECPLGTVPIRRVTLEEMTRFGSLQEFFRKPPRGRGRHPRLSPPEDPISEVHKYAHAYQNVNNLGGHSFLNVWDPAVGSQVFSLAQHWYAGGTPVQTVECGWQVFPEKYQTTAPVLFIYWTADGYDKTGSYNSEGKEFIQTSSVWPVGSALNASASGGNQVELEVLWQLIGGNWWLYLNGTTPGNAVGYYPATLFNGGQMATSATSIDYGGEVVNQAFWPPMGSGAFPAQGYREAAYQRDIYYFDTAAVALPASLAPVQDSPSCYKIELAQDADPWNVNFFFGGPGGSGCE